ncbi:MAG: CAP domain-containing protein, partial [Cyanobacterium sp.]
MNKITSKKNKVNNSLIKDIDQLMLEYVNRARLNPSQEANRLLDGNLNQGLEQNLINTHGKQPLAFNLDLTQSARDHSQWMLENNIFSHTGINNTSSRERMVTAGYEFNVSGSSGENLSWRGSTGEIKLEDWVVRNYEGLFISPGHRINILNENFQEIGISSLVGTFTQDNVDYNALMTTQNFAFSGNEGAFLTGVIYDDSIVQDNFYTIGEGIADVTIRAKNVATGKIFETENWSTGGYSLYLPSGEYKVSFIGDLTNDSEIDTVNRSILIDSQNIKLDILPTDVIPVAINIPATEQLLTFSKDNLQILYIPLTGRPGDSQGLEFWKNAVDGHNINYSPSTGDTLMNFPKEQRIGYETIINDFASSSETIGLFFAENDNLFAINLVYENAFNRSAEEEGLNYWGNALEVGDVTFANLALEITLGARGSDVTILKNKVASAELFTQQLNSLGMDSRYVGEEAEKIGFDF